MGKRGRPKGSKNKKMSRGEGKTAKKEPDYSKFVHLGEKNIEKLRGIGAKLNDAADAIDEIVSFIDRVGDLYDERNADESDDEED